MKQIFLKCINNEYIADIDISVEEWKTMLQNQKIFYKECIDMIKDWYNQPMHLATTKEIMAQNKLSSSPYNGIGCGLG